MNRRAANALRLLAIVYIVSTIKTVVIGILRDATLAKLQPEFHSEPVDTHALMERLQSIGKVSMILHLGLLAVTLVGFVLLAMSVEKRRGLVSAAIVLLLAYVGYTVYQQLYPSMSEPGFSTIFVWIAAGAAFTVAGMLPLIVAARQLPGWDKAQTAISGALLLILLPIALDAFVLLGHKYSTGWQWGYRLTDIAYTAWFVIFGLTAARAIESGTPPPAMATAGGTTLKAGPLRAIGWAILVRVGIGFAVAIGTIVSAMHGAYDSLAGMAVGSTVIGVITTLFLIGGLAGYSKYPAPHRNDGLYVVIGLLVIAVILDIVTAKTTSTLYGLIDKAQHADSMWSMPSISEMESMQSTVAWTGRISIVLGVVSMLILLGSLATTARSVGAPDLARIAGVTIALVVIAAFGAILVGVWMENVKRKDESTLLLLAIVLLVVAVWALTNTLRVVFGVANAVERPAIPAADPLP
ncbi:MAG: hypothetical protein JWO36_3770 [Myxococcales bacterium]|nr:hypothetical protein [Myxococcales bacterium]